MAAYESRECAIIQDLLPIYADGELSAASTRLVEEHVAGCGACQAELVAYHKPLFPPEKQPKDEEISTDAPLFWRRLRRTAWVVAILALLGTGGLALATYHVGRNMALQDPHYRLAVKEDLFTPVYQTQKVGPYEITVERLLLDNAQTVAFYHTEPAVRDNEQLRLTLKDQEGRSYETLAGFSYGGKDHVAKLETVAPGAQELELEFQVADTMASGLFTVPVDPGTVWVSIREW